MAAKKLGLEEVPTVCLSYLSSTQVKAYILADMERYDKREQTLIACEQLNRKCYTMELDEHERFVIG